MAQSIEIQRTRLPLAVYHFRVWVKPLVPPAAPQGADVGLPHPRCLSFTEITGIAIDYDHVTYRHGLSFWEGESIQTFWQNRFMPITCKRGTVLGADPLFLYAWLRDKIVRSLEIDLCDEKGRAVMSWTIAAAVPVSLKAPAFNASSNDVSIDTLELQVKGIAVALVESK